MNTRNDKPGISQEALLAAEHHGFVTTNSLKSGGVEVAPTPLLCEVVALDEKTQLVENIHTGERDTLLHIEIIDRLEVFVLATVGRWGPPELDCDYFWKHWRVVKEQ